MNWKNKMAIAIACLIVAIVAGIGTYKYLDGRKDKDKQTEKPTTPTPEVKLPEANNETDYNIKLIKTVHSTQNDNYLISPYSIEIALSMLRDGAAGDSEKQITNVIGNRNIPVFTAKERISVSNAAFIKESYKNGVKQSYYDKLSTYGADLVFDKYENPDKINNWVNEHTYKMIPKILEDISPDFVMGLANAVAIDVKWANQFECINTTSEEFVNGDKKTNVEMMHDTYRGGSAKYFETDDAKGIILPYLAYDKDGLNPYESNEKDFTELEFVGILPNGTVEEYINGLSKEKLSDVDKKIVDTTNSDIRLSLPRFKYRFDLQGFKDVLVAMGITDVFDPNKADFSNIMDMSIYVSEAIHKTYIDLNEKGTKAAAVTYFGMEKNAMPEQRKEINIKFNKPFVYMIRDSKTKEILFFGVVKSPNVWKGSTCSNEK